MRFVAILNRQGGTFRTLDLDAFKTRLTEIIEAEGHQIEIETVSGKRMRSALQSAVKRKDCDVVMAGGGDGTASAAAGVAMNSGKMLAILPAGTMNLFARSLAIPLDLDEAAKVFAGATARKVDIATANGRPFIHQFSVGLHPKLVRLREERAFVSRLGKIRASITAGLEAILNPPRLMARLTVDGSVIEVTTASIGISNNMFGEGHIPFTDSPDGGVLGIYVARAREPRALILFALDMAAGRWRRSREVDIHRGRKVKLELLSGQSRFGCTMDGELCKLEDSTDIAIHPGALTVLAPPKDAA